MHKNRIFIVLCFILIAAMFCGCAGPSGSSAAATPTTEPTSTPKQTPTPVPSYWVLKYYVDEFGDPTDDFYVGSDILTGTFSNNATSEADLALRIAYDDDVGFRFTLMEYGRSKALHISSDQKVLKFKLDDNIYSCNLKSGDSISSDVYTDTTDMQTSDIVAYETMREQLLRGNSVTCLIYLGDSKYQFVVPAEGFYEAILKYIYQTENRGGE